MADVCVVCGETVAAGESSICSNCGEPFHLNQRNDRPGKDCGTVWINDQYLALEFACQRCLDEPNAPPPAARPAIRKLRTAPRRYRKRA